MTVTHAVLARFAYIRRGSDGYNSLKESGYLNPKQLFLEMGFSFVWKESINIVGYI